MQKKVIIITPFYPPNIGGAENFAQELFKQSNKTHNTFVCTMSWNKNKVWKGINWSDGFHVVSRLLLAGWVDCSIVKPHTVHALGLNAAFVSAILKKIFKFKLIVTPLSLYDFKNNKLLSKLSRWALSYADVIFAESYISYKNLSLVTDRHKIKVFTHWVDHTKFYPNYCKHKRLQVLFVGRTLKEKGRYIIEEVERHLEGVDFHYAEHIAREEMPAYFQMADVLCVPSLYAESPNLVVAEGASCGCVVITSNKGALPEQVKDFGFSIKPTTKQFKTLINKLDKNRVYLSALRQKTIKYAKENLTEKNANTIIKEY